MAEYWIRRQRVTYCEGLTTYMLRNLDVLVKNGTATATHRKGRLWKYSALRLQQLLMSRCKVLCSFIMHRHGLGWSIHSVQCGCWMCNIVLVCLVYRCYVIHFIAISLGSYLFSSQESSALSLGERALWWPHSFVYSDTSANENNSFRNHIR